VIAPFDDHASQKRLLLLDGEGMSDGDLHSNLYSAGFSVTDVTRIGQALALCDVMHFDVILLHMNGPQDNEASICGTLRSTVPYAAILVVGGSNDLAAKIAAFEAGADDYLTRPFHVGELAARIRAILRRGAIQSQRRDAVITIGEISLDPARHTVLKGGRVVHISPKEFGVLHYLMLNAGRPVPHSSLLTAIWGPDFAEELTYLRTVMRHLRVKLDDVPVPTYIQTDSHVGYRFVEPEKAPRM
jgi:two-component system KDP operon response regulator KdpE